jgi:hypothetical protein
VHKAKIDCLDGFVVAAAAVNPRVRASAPPHTCFGGLAAFLMHCGHLQIAYFIPALLPIFSSASYLLVTFQNLLFLKQLIIPTKQLTLLHHETVTNPFCDGNVHLFYQSECPKCWRWYPFALYRQIAGKRKPRRFATNYHGGFLGIWHR